MILYSLACDRDDRFEAWFRSSEDCEAQIAARQCPCPTCGSCQVAKAIMAPSVVKGQAPLTRTAPQEAGTRAGLLAEIRTRALAAQNVGWAFAERVRAMSDGLEEPSDIKGMATPDDAQALIDDGIEITPVPSAPNDLN